jgi:DNA helicase II / ATP-dependent DNA helicase PcrA
VSARKAIAAMAAGGVSAEGELGAGWASGAAGGDPPPGAISAARLGESKLSRAVSHEVDVRSSRLAASARDEVGEGRLAAVPDRLAAWASARQVVPAAARESADALIAALVEARAEPRPGPRAEGLRDVLAPLIRLRYPDGALRVQDLDQLVAAAHQAADPRHFVAELVLDPPQSSADLAQPPHLDEDYLVLSTIHSAKGLEWDAVHVLAVYDGNFPACLSAGSREEIDEERRLLYVGMTRARRALTVYVPVRYHHRPHGKDDAHGYGKPSRFLTPEVLACCEVKRLPDDPLNPYGAPVSNGRRVVVSPDALFD